MQVVGAIIRNHAGEFLLQLRDENAPTFKNCWTLFGGHVEPGEAPNEAIVRELYEELRLTPENMESCKFIMRDAHEHAVEQLVYEIQTNVTIDQLVLGEGKAMEYVGVDALFDREFGFNIKQVLMTYLEKQKSL